MVKDIVFTLGMHLAKIKTMRSSVIPYIYRKKSGEILFLLAIDKKSGDITDFGGGVKKNENSLIAGLREFEEESNKIFGDLYFNLNDIYTNIAIKTSDDKMSSLFIPVSEEWSNKAEEMFDKTKEDFCQKNFKEVDGVKWFNLEEFMKMVYNHSRMWNRIRNFYNKVSYNKLVPFLKTNYMQMYKV